MAVAVATSPYEIRLRVKYKDVRVQSTSSQLLIDPATPDIEINTFCAALDNATNCALVVDVESIRAVTGLKASAIDATEANLSEVMMMILSAINPITLSGKVSGKYPIYAMVRAIENFPDGSLNMANANIIAIDTFLNTRMLYKDGAGTFHAGLLKVQASSQHITEEDEVDTL